MDFSSVAAISMSGMEVERTRLQVSALNMANMHSTRSVNGGPYRPMGVISVQSSNNPFSSHLGNTTQAGISGAEVMTIQSKNLPPRLMFEPGHPDADGKGFVAYPAVDTISEMVNVMSAVRSYEANVMAINAAKAMASKALTIGS
jgi:flagellar basal-body rod protein FlgC